MKPPYYEPDLIQWLQLSGEVIGRMDDHTQLRADWILFLLDEIKGFVPAEEYQTILEQLGAAVSNLQDEAGQ